MCVQIFVGLCIVRVHSYGYQQPVQYYLQPVQYQPPVQYYQQPSYTSTAKPYYPSSSSSYYTTTAKPYYYPTTTYPTTAYYSTTYPTTSYYTTKAYETPAAYQQPTTAAYYQTSQAYYEQQPTYTTPGYYPDNYNANENVRNPLTFRLTFLCNNSSRHLYVLRDGTTMRSSSTSTITATSNRGAKLTRIPSPGASTLSVCQTVANKSSTTKPTRTATGLKSRTSRPAAVSTATSRIITARQSMDHPSSIAANINRNVTRIVPCTCTILTLFPLRTPENSCPSAAKLSPLVFMINLCNL